MNRRDAIRSVLSVAGVTAVGGATVKSLTLDATDKPPALAVLEYPGHLSSAAASNVVKAWRNAGVFPCKIVVLEQGARLRFYDASGRELSLDVESI